MSKVTFDYSKACSFIQEHEMEYMSELAAQAKDKLVAKTGAGNDFLGWIDLPVDSWDGSISRLTMTKKSLTASRKRRRRSARTPKSFW